jgi:hypothetical protein
MFGNNDRDGWQTLFSIFSIIKRKWKKKKEFVTSKLAQP